MNRPSHTKKMVPVSVILSHIVLFLNYLGSLIYNNASYFMRYIKFKKPQDTNLVLQLHSSCRRRIKHQYSRG